MKVCDLIRLRHINQIKNGGEFTFSITYSPESLKEIEEMKSDFTSKYQYTVADIPGMQGHRIICISLRDQNRR
jgi:hypothetical protein